MNNETHSQLRVSQGPARALNSTSFVLRFPDALAQYLEDEAERRGCAISLIVADGLVLYRAIQQQEMKRSVLAIEEKREALTASAEVVKERPSSSVPRQQRHRRRRRAHG